MTDEKESTPTAKDFVYAGRRQSAKDGKIIHAVYVLSPKDGKPEDERPFFYDAKVFGRGGLSIGVVYRGASFDNARAYGLPDARWLGKYHDAASIVQWEAADDRTMRELAAKRLEKTHKGEVETILLPLRRHVQTLRRRGAHSDASALVNLVMAEMYRPLTKTELEDVDD